MPISSFYLSIKSCDLIGIVLLLLFLGCTTSSPPEPIIDVPRDEAPSWSPDGSQIAYHHHNPDADDAEYPTGLYVLTLETGERSLVLEGPTFNPDWSPDDKWLAFNSGDIFIIRPDGNELQKMTEHGSAFFPRWSPDGMTLSYSRSGDQEEVGIWFLHIEDSIITKFGFGAAPADWSPNGHKIVYEGPQGVSEDGGNQIWKADTSDSNQIQLTSNNFISNRTPAWSANREWIAWSVLYEGIEWGLWVMRSDGTDQKELLHINNDNLISFEQVAPSWGPNSEQIVFSKPTSKEDKITLWVIKRDGTGLTQITH